MTRPPAVPEEVHVELELLAAWGELEHRVMELLERRALAEQAEAGSDARHVRVDRDVAHAVSEQQDASGGLTADAGERDQLVARLGDGEAGEVLVERGNVDLAQDLLDPDRLDLGDAAGTDRAFDV